MDRPPRIDEQMHSLAAYLNVRRDAILESWRIAIARDPQMTTGTALPRTQLNDHLPVLLDDYAQRLRTGTRPPSAALAAEYKADAAAHGLQRWQQGYDLREVTREWGRLQLCVVDELERYASAHSELDAGVMPRARRLWAQLCSEGISESTARYYHLQQIEAVGHLRDLEQALEQVQELERQRAELWRQAAHDLRGNLGVVANATVALTVQDVSEPLRNNFLRMLKRNVAALHSLLDDVTNLARLQAGREQRQVKSFDAAEVLAELCESLRPLAEERELFLKAEGPEHLPIDGDAIKVRRIAQNLLLNALKYTPDGGVTVTWGDSREDDAERWMLSVTDTGPGFHAGPGAPMAGALEDATTEARHVEARAADVPHVNPAREPPALPADARDQRPIHQEQGEGIGLSIVKRLCELLDATVEMESRPGTGTSFRIVFPRRYEAADAPRAGA